MASPPTPGRVAANRASEIARANRADRLERSRFASSSRVRAPAGGPRGGFLSARDVVEPRTLRVVIELFAGWGGSSLAFEAAGGHVGVYFDDDEDALRVLFDNAADASSSNIGGGDARRPKRERFFPTVDLLPGVRDDVGSRGRPSSRATRVESVASAVVDRVVALLEDLGVSPRRLKPTWRRTRGGRKLRWGMELLDGVDIYLQVSPPCHDASNQNASGDKEVTFAAFEFLFDVEGAIRRRVPITSSWYEMVAGHEIKRDLFRMNTSVFHPDAPGDLELFDLAPYRAFSVDFGTPQRRERVLLFSGNRRREESAETVANAMDRYAVLSRVLTPATVLGIDPNRWSYGWTWGGVRFRGVGDAATTRFKTITSTPPQLYRGEEKYNMGISAMLLLMGLDHRAFHIPADLEANNKTRCKAGIANMVPLGLATAAWRATMYGWPTRAMFDDDEETRRLDEQETRAGRRRGVWRNDVDVMDGDEMRDGDVREADPETGRTGAADSDGGASPLSARRRPKASNPTDRWVGGVRPREPAPGRSHASVHLPPLPVSREAEDVARGEDAEASASSAPSRVKADDAASGEPSGYFARLARVRATLKNPHDSLCSAGCCDRRGEVFGEDGLVRCRQHATAARDLFARRWRRGVGGKLEHAVCSVCLSIDGVDEGSPVFRPKQADAWVADGRRDVREGVGDFAVPCVVATCPHIACETCLAAMYANASELRAKRSRWRCWSCASKRPVDAETQYAESRERRERDSSTSRVRRLLSPYAFTRYFAATFSTRRERIEHERRLDEAGEQYAGKPPRVKRKRETGGGEANEDDLRRMAEDDLRRMAALERETNDARPTSLFGRFRAFFFRGGE